MEHKTIATIDRLSREVHHLRVQHMATWSLVDALTKAFFTCVPEPPFEIGRKARNPLSGSLACQLLASHRRTPAATTPGPVSRFPGWMF